MSKKNIIIGFFVVAFFPLIMFSLFMSSVFGAIASAVGVEEKWGIYLGYLVTAYLIYSIVTGDIRGMPESSYVGFDGMMHWD